MIKFLLFKKPELMKVFKVLDIELHHCLYLYHIYPNSYMIYYIPQEFGTSQNPKVAIKKLLTTQKLRLRI